MVAVKEEKPLNGARKAVLEYLSVCFCLFVPSPNNGDNSMQHTIARLDFVYFKQLKTLSSGSR